jgi:hypothetical protein
VLILINIKERQRICGVAKEDHKRRQNAEVPWREVERWRGGEVERWRGGEEGFSTQQ